jgi:hypothetical protein
LNLTDIPVLERNIPSFSLSGIFETAAETARPLLFMLCSIDAYIYRTLLVQKRPALTCLNIQALAE